MSKSALIKMARNYGFNPVWKPLPHFGENIFGLGLTVDCLGVPLMVKMEKA